MHLFGLATALGRADFEDRVAIAELGKRLRGAIDELRQHAQHEDTFIHPLLAVRAPEVAAALEREHQWVEGALVEIEEGLRRCERSDDCLAAGADLYRAWCRMASTYLAHLENEESLGMRALWQTCSDDEIFAVIKSFLGSRSTDDLMNDLRRQASALTPQERAAYVAGVMRSGTVPAQQIWEGLAESLAGADLARLRADLAA